MACSAGLPLLTIATTAGRFRIMLVPSLQRYLLQDLRMVTLVRQPRAPLIASMLQVALALGMAQVDGRAVTRAIVREHKAEGSIIH